MNDKRLLDMNAEITRLEREYVRALRTAWSVRAAGRNADGWLRRANALSVASNNLLVKRNAFACDLAAERNAALPGKAF